VCRIATATITKGSGGSLRLTGWQIEPGFGHDPSVLEGRTAPARQVGLSEASACRFR
jgi:hypothetical protein